MGYPVILLTQAAQVAVKRPGKTSKADYFYPTIFVEL